jgi:hypothetical protein
MGFNRSLLIAATIAGLAAGACTSTIKVAIEPIVISAKLEADVRVRREETAPHQTDAAFEPAASGQASNVTLSTSHPNIGRRSSKTP